MKQKNMGGLLGIALFLLVTGLLMRGQPQDSTPDEQTKDWYENNKMSIFKVADTKQNVKNGFLRVVLRNEQGVVVICNESYEESLHVSYAVRYGATEFKPTLYKYYNLGRSCEIFNSPNLQINKIVFLPVAY